ncbi:Peroxiredoxin [Pustulibacterium marinum]|uniref:thioredoxin-dependent peroxiredoxin n=1 Tax=Pustulibacterium marinum TaxID=1224947 RepID=A0A1I7G241_9FLAO|nr:peroxiredoxin-like family protein [Pustulibacterium marinum]SFU42473.1 Peroxiredoxin [Pustulibacterium marinum]
MKKLLIGVLALTLCFSCETSEKKEEKSTSPNTEDLTEFGIKQGEDPKGLQVGTKVPDIEIEVEGRAVPLAKLYAEKPLVLFFYRGSWCPHCNKYLSQMAEQASTIQENATLVAVTPETRDYAEKMKGEKKAHFLVASDISGEVMDAFNVGFGVTNAYQENLTKNKISLTDRNASHQSVLPVPATYIINTHGEIVYRFVNPDYTKRAPIEEIIKVVDQL